MADLRRKAKSGPDWTAYDLDAFNITFQDLSLEDFFSTSELPDVPSDLRLFSDTPYRITSRVTPASARASDSGRGPSPQPAGERRVDPETHKLLHYLDLAHNRVHGQKSAVDVFFMKLMERLGFASGLRIFQLRHTLPLLNCAMNCSAQIDLCLIDDQDILFLVQEDRFGSQDDPEPQLVAAAIAVFQRNNRVRQRELLLPALEHMTLPAMTIVGTTPTFYEFHITSALNQAIVHGTYPPVVSTFYRHIPKLPLLASDGMKPVNNRRTIIKYLLALKNFVSSSD